MSVRLPLRLEDDPGVTTLREGRPSPFKADEQRAWDDACPNAAEHCIEGYGLSYIGWHEWANTKGRTYRNVACRGCGYYLVWRPKVSARREDK